MSTAPIAQGPVDVTVRRHLQTMRELLACFNAWEPQVRVLGNVRADDAAAAVAYVLKDLEQEAKAREGDKDAEIKRLREDLARATGMPTATEAARNVALEKMCDQLKAENAKLARVLKASAELVCAPAWAGVSDEDCELERVLRECGYVEAPAESVPTRAERLAEERRAEFHAEMRADAFGDRF